jgi:type I restriction enzyme R subunit
MLAAELQLRTGEDEEFEPLSEKLKRIIQEKRKGTLAGIALLKELEMLAKETVRLIQEAKRPLTESISLAAKERSEALADDIATKIAAALLVKADEILFPGWTDQDHVSVELFREFTKILAKQFPGAELHGRDKDFVDRCIKLLQRANYKGKSDG